MEKAAIDPERPRDANAFDRAEGYSGQGYAIERERAEERPTIDAPAAAIGDEDMPPDNGHRASADPVSGEVHGSGSGIGGGNPGEDFDAATPSGETYPLTGGEGTDHVASDLGPLST